MKNIILLFSIIGLLVFMAVGCTSDSRNMFGDSIANTVTNKAFDSMTSKATEESKTSSKKSKATADYVPSDADAHFIQPSDYFIADKEFPGQGYIWVNLSKVVTAPSTQTKNEGLFMMVGSGKEIWTKYYWKSRIAAKGEIKIGKTIIAFNDNREDDIYYAPENKEGARTDSWFMAKITDTTDMYKGYVMVSGGYKVAIDNIRIPLK
ncbi:MAG TPA: hypothetical protein PKJ69_00230 [Spirochaetota bacterium]|nr:hypothetical protein [Spirochaetota bacterium]HQL42480.1 hypothetical protein [Spirochaetota bacterium]